MRHLRKMKISVILFLITAVTSCGIIKDSLVQYNIVPTEAKRYQPEGALFFGTLETPAAADVKGVTLFFESASDLSLPTFTSPSKQTSILLFMADVCLTNAKINRFSVRYASNGFPQEKIVLQTYLYKIPETMDSRLETISNVIEVITTNTSYLLIMSPGKKGNQIITNNVWNIQTNKTVTVMTTRRVFYAGRMRIMNKKSYIDDYEYYINYTNCFEEDKELFKMKYSDISNYILVPLEVAETN